MNSCAFSPDGARIVSTGYDQALRVWDAATGVELATLMLPGDQCAVAAHPSSPLFACGDWRVELMGTEYGPIIVTAAERERGLAIRCPACWQELPVGRDHLGSVAACPTPDCGLRLQVNPFVIRTDRSHRKRGGLFGRLLGR